MYGVTASLHCAASPIATHPMEEYYLIIYVIKYMVKHEEPIMVTKKSVSETRLRFTSLQDELNVDDVIAVTRRGEPEMALMRWELYEGLVSTLEVLSDRELMDTLRSSLEDVREGRLVTLDELEQELDGAVQSSAHENGL
jgi:PHD/YefM family antitoxin component YafN of YafNO toxin-antitoxin module